MDSVTAADRHHETSLFRWEVISLAFLATVIDYLDRQTLSVIAPELKRQFQMTDETYGLSLSANIGNIAGGAFTQWMIHHRVPVRKARKIAVSVFALRMTSATPAVFAGSAAVALA